MSVHSSPSGESNHPDISSQKVSSGTVFQPQRRRPLAVYPQRHCILVFFFVRRTPGGAPFGSPFRGWHLRCALGHINALPELLKRVLASEVGRRIDNDSMSSPDSGHEHVSLTNCESSIRTEVADPRITHGRYHVETGKGTAAIALGFLLECCPIAAPGIFAPRQFHVVRHGRSRPDGAT